MIARSLHNPNGAVVASTRRRQGRSLALRLSCANAACGTEPEAQARSVGGARRVGVGRFGITVGVLFVLAQTSFAQLSGASAARSPLAAKQEIVRDRMSQLEDRLFRLAGSLAETDPDQAGRLRAALARSRERLVRRTMDDIVDLLGRGEATEASDRQRVLIEHLNEILSQLLADAEKGEDAKNRLRALTEMRDRVASLLAEQRRQREAADALAASGGDARPDDVAALARRQREASDEAERIANDMSPSPRDRRPEVMPGRENIQQAHWHMKAAAGLLDGGRLEPASVEQDRASQQLREAIRKLDDSRRQLGREGRDELLRAFEDRFREMLARQTAINGDTDELARAPVLQWSRSEQLRSARLGHEEESLAAAADDVKRMVDEAGQSAVVSMMLEPLADDLRQVAERLSSLDAGVETRRLQADIVETLRALLDAVSRRRPPASQPSKAPHADAGEEEGTLLPDSVELKLLRKCQARLNRDTIAFDRQRVQGTPLLPDQQGRLQRIAERQKRVADMARQLHERGSRPRQPLP